MATGDFAQKLCLVLKALNLSRTRLAQTLEVNKSLVSRWAAGVQVPSEHNLSLLTEVVARHRAGLAQGDWDLDSAAFAARFADPVTAASERRSIAVLAFRNLERRPKARLLCRRSHDRDHCRPIAF